METNLTMFTRKFAVALGAAAVFFAASTADAGLFCKKDCCKPCCEPAPAPVCCEPAPAPVCCEPAPAPVCCPAPPADVTKTLCLVDPCTGCSKTVDVCIPACCAEETPCIKSRDGIFGRKIFYVTWKCCDHKVKVVWTAFGGVRVH